MSLNQDNESFMQDDKDGDKVDAPIKGKEEVKLTATLYTTAYFAQLKTVKDKHRLKISDQVELFWRSSFIYFIQIAFCAVIAIYANLKAVIHKNTEVHVTLFFTVLLLHVTCLPNARDGLAMMKYALLHADEFESPLLAFTLGFYALSSMITAELVNVASSQTKKNVGDAISGFIGFKLLVDLPNIYMNSHEEFPLKSAVGKLSFKRGRYAERETVIDMNWIVNPLYTLLYTFYKSVFFYFFPFAASFIPFLRSLEGNVKAV